MMDITLQNRSSSNTGRQEGRRRKRDFRARRRALARHRVDRVRSLVGSSPSLRHGPDSFGRRVARRPESLPGLALWYGVAILFAAMLVWG